MMCDSVDDFVVKHVLDNMPKLELLYVHGDNRVTVSSSSFFLNKGAFGSRPPPPDRMTALKKEVRSSRDAKTGWTWSEGVG
jgi:hypothetical protein